MKYKVGDKIKFVSEKQRYTIKACDDRFLICTKPFNAKKTFLYCIVDLKHGVRGPDNYRCKFDYDQKEEAEKALIELHTGDVEISRRRSLKLDIEH